MKDLEDYLTWWKENSRPNLETELVAYQRELETLELIHSLVASNCTDDEITTCVQNTLKVIS